MKKKLDTTKEAQPRSPNNRFDGKTQNGAHGAGSDIVQLILRDHEPIKNLIETLKDDDLKKADKEESFEEFAFYLKGHAMAEEQTLYVAMKNIDALQMPGLEGDTEHAIADQLLQEVNAAADEKEWLAKVKVLAELVEHHIEEEESEMLDQVSEKMPQAMRLNVGAEYTKLFNEYMALNEVQEPRHIHFKKVALPPVVRL
jgi:hemerythrin superfamily protein